jgi:hypothetical protein
MSDDIYKGHFVFAKGRPAWHRKGLELAGMESIDESMRLAGVSGWEVEAIPLDALVGGRVIEIDSDQGSMDISWQEGYNLHVLTRLEGGKRRPLTDQLVRSMYTPIQNETVIKHMIEFLTGQGFKPDAMGVLGRLGNRVFVTFDLGKTTVAGNEEYQRYLVALVDHSGRGAVRFLRASIRVVCANTEALAVQHAMRSGHMYGIHHSDAAVAEFWDNGDVVRKILSVDGYYEAALRSTAEYLQSVPFNEEDYGFFMQVWEEPFAKQSEHKDKNKRPSPRQITYHENARAALLDSWDLEVKRAEALGQSTSLWTAKQAISTYVQHLSPGGTNRKLNRSMALMEGKQPNMQRTLTANLKESLPVEWFHESEYADHLQWL